MRRRIGNAEYEQWKAYFAERSRRIEEASGRGQPPGEEDENGESSPPRRPAMGRRR